MDRSQFANTLREATISALHEYCRSHDGETPYAFAIIEGQAGAYLGYAIATEQGLRRTAAEYLQMGYRYQGWDWEVFDNQDKLAIYLRWSNPDDGWAFGDFPDQLRVQQHLDSLVKAEAFGVNSQDLEEFCTDVLSSLPSSTDWQLLQSKQPVIVGVTRGEDPRDFVRTASRCNPYQLARQLWRELFQADELEARIKRPTR